MSRVYHFWTNSGYWENCVNVRQTFCGQLGFGKNLISPYEVVCHPHQICKKCQEVFESIHQRSAPAQVLQRCAKDIASNTIGQALAACGSNWSHQEVTVPALDYEASCF